MATPIQLPPLEQRIILNPVGVKGGAAAFSKSMGAVTKSTGKANVATAAMGTSLNTLAFRAQTAGRVLLKNFALPLAAIGALAIRSFGNFEKSMLRIEALVGVSAGQVARFGEAVKAASIETGRSPQELADAMFFVASAGLRGATAMEVLGASARGAAIGLGETKVVADAATSAVNAYGAENLSGKEAVDVLTAAVREGKVEANRLAPAIGKAIPVASAMGIEFHEVAAAIAAMTRTGTDARTSAIQLRQIMQSILDPSRQTTKALKEMGIAENELRRQADDEGLLAVLVRLRDLARDNEDAFADVFPNIRALAGALDITGANLTENEGIFRALANSVGDTDEAFQKTQKGAMFKLTKALAEVKTNMLALGEAMLPLLDVFIGFIGVVADLIKKLSAGPFAKSMAVMLALTTITGSLLITFGKLAAILAFTKAAMARYTVSVLMGVKATALLSAVTGVLALTLVAVVAVGLAVAFLGWGKEAENTAQKLADLAGEIRDVRQMGERSIRPIHMFTDALTNMTGAVGDARLIQDFNMAFQETIQLAGEISAIGGQLQAEESLLSGFFGTLAGVSDQDAIDDTMDTFDVLLETFKKQMGDDFFTRLFGDPADMDAAILAFLQGEDPEGVADMLAHVWSDRIGIGFESAFDDAMERFTKYTADQRTDALEGAIKLGAGRLRPAFSEIAGLFAKAMTSGNPESALNIYTEIIDRLVDTTDMSAKEIDVAMGMVEKAFMDSLHKIDGFTQDSGKGIDDLHTMLMMLADDTEDGLLKSDFSGDQNWIDFAELYVQKLQEIQREIDTANRLGTGEFFGLDEFAAHRMALEQAIRLANAHNRTLSGFDDDPLDAIETVNDAILTMEKGFAAADEAAKQLNSRFDDLMGRGINLQEAQIDFNRSLVDMVEALDESDGSISAFTESGMDARQTLLDAGLAAKDWAAVMLEMNFTQEQTQRQFEATTGAILANALNMGVSSADAEELFKSIGIGPETISLLFADPNAEASEALMLAAEGIADNALPFIFREGLDIGDAMLHGFTQGLRGGSAGLHNATEEVFKNLVNAVRTLLGIDSPSTVFRDEVGKPIMEGITVGFAETAMKKKSQWKNILRSFITDAISVTKGHINSASSAVNAILSLEEAEKKLAKVKREHQAIDGGPVSRREGLNERQLQRRVDEAQRALRLGQGHQEDLEMSLLDAKEALADFEANIDSDSPIQKAELALMDAGFAVAASQAEMKMNGDDATAAFKNMAEAVGISVEKVDALLAVPTEGQGIFETLFPANVRSAIDDVAEGLGWVKTKADEATESLITMHDILFPPTPSLDEGAAGARWQAPAWASRSQTDEAMAAFGSEKYAHSFASGITEDAYVAPPIGDYDWGGSGFIDSVSTLNQEIGNIYVQVSSIESLTDIHKLVTSWGNAAGSLGQMNRNKETTGIFGGTPNIMTETSEYG